MRHTLIDTRNYSLIGVLVSMMILSEFIYLITGLSYIFVAISAGGVALFFESLMRSKVTFEEVFLLLFISVGVVVNAVFVESDLKILGLLIVSFGIAATALHGSISPQLSRFIMLSFTAMIITQVYVFGRSGNDIFALGSRNYISAIAIYLAAFVYLIDDIHGRTVISVWPAFAALALSIISLGRSGIALSLLMFLVVLYLRAGDYMKRNRGIKILFISIGVIALGIFLWREIGDFFILWFSTSRFFYSGIQSPRYRLWTEYFRHLSFQDAIFGFDLTEVPLIAQYNGNPHNAFLKIWARAGIFGLITVVVSVYALFHMRKRSPVLCMCFAMILIRAFFDIIILINWLDFVFFSYLFYSLRQSKHSQRDDVYVGA